MSTGRGEIEPGPVVWITGLSGAGKSTTARSLQQSLHAEGHRPLLLDGDEFRAAVGDDLGHSPADRLLSARRLIRFAAMASGQGVPVIVATMSLFAEVHEEVRLSLPRLRVVYLHAPVEFLAERDAKGLYSAAQQGQRTDVVGVHLPFHPPPTPELSIDVSRATDILANVALIRRSLAAWLPITSA
jgi:adenylylsulfate kinase